MFERLGRALAKRAANRAHTDAWRIVDGRGDDFEDLEIDDFAGRWLVQTRGTKFPEWLRDVKDPLAIYWKKLGENAAPSWIGGEKIDAPFLIRENGAQFEIDFAAGASQGIFLDQRDNRQAVREMARGMSVLNCFAYTCAFGVSAALGGAETVNVDLSKNYLAWGRRNYDSNNIEQSGHQFLHGDVASWMERFARKGRRFDLIILDPPTFSRNEKGRVFRVESDFAELVRLAEKNLTPSGTIFCSTNQRTLTPEAFQSLIRTGLARPEQWKMRSAPMPPDFRGEQYLKSIWLRRAVD